MTDTQDLIPPTCADCDGTGEMDCECMNEIGPDDNDCEECGNAGWVDCLTCGGLGYIEEETVSGTSTKEVREQQAS